MFAQAPVLEPMQLSIVRNFSVNACHASAECKASLSKNAAPTAYVDKLHQSTRTQSTTDQSLP